MYAIIENIPIKQVKSFKSIENFTKLYFGKTAKLQLLLIFYISFSFTPHHPWIILSPASSVFGWYFIFCSFCVATTEVLAVGSDQVHVIVLFIRSKLGTSHCLTSFDIQMSLNLNPPPLPHLAKIKVHSSLNKYVRENYQIYESMEITLLTWLVPVVYKRKY